MTIKQSQNPYGYKNLLVYKKAEELQSGCSLLTQNFPKAKTLVSLADQMDRSARSVKQNVVEGWKRNSTKEYYEFLGFAIAANAELEEDCSDVCKGIYPELMGIRGVMGEKGEMGVVNERKKMGERGKMGGVDEGGIKNERMTNMRTIESLLFYPLSPILPPVVQLKLRCKELNFLLDRLQQSLLEKMRNENSLSVTDKLNLADKRVKEEKQWFENFLAEKNLIHLENGQVVKREKGNKRE